MIRVNETIVGPGGEELKAGKTYRLMAEQEKYLIINRRAVAVEDVPEKTDEKKKDEKK